MTRHDPDSTTIQLALELLNSHGFEDLSGALQLLFNEAMKIERSDYLGAGPYERSEDRRGYANGFKPKNLKTRIGTLELAIPQVRERDEGGEKFYPAALERGLRSERALTAALAEMYVQGVSTRRVRKITEELCGTEISSSQVSRATKLLDEEIGQWRSRALDPCPYIVLDARYEKVRIGGVVVSAAVFVAMGVMEDGRRTILGISAGTSEAEVHWREFLESLQLRGLRGVRLITSDSHSGLKAAINATFPGAAWQRCQFHLQRNAMHHVSKLSLRGEVANCIRRIFAATDQVEANGLINDAIATYESAEPKLAAWMAENLLESLAVLQIPTAHRKRLRTSNAVERLNREIKRRTKVASIFPNTESLLRLVTALAIEVSEDWETGRIYLTMEPR